jgi:gamma-glutamylaminecyclotransferase
MATTTLFLYGTLKRGGRNNHLLAGQEFIGEARTLPFYRLYDHGAHPCLVEDRLHGVSVQGELWRVEDTALARLDGYEEVPSYFSRRDIDIDGNAFPTYAYFYEGDVSALKECGSCWPAEGSEPEA